MCEGKGNNIQLFHQRAAPKRVVFSLYFCCIFSFFADSGKIHLYQCLKKCVSPTNLRTTHEIFAAQHRRHIATPPPHTGYFLLSASAYMFLLNPYFLNPRFLRHLHSVVSMRVSSAKILLFASLLLKKRVTFRGSICMKRSGNTSTSSAA